MDNKETFLQNFSLWKNNLQMGRGKDLVYPHDIELYETNWGHVNHSSCKI